MGRWKSRTGGSGRVHRAGSATRFRDGPIFQLDLESEEGQRTVSRLRDALRMVLVGLFVDPEPHLH